MPSKTILTKRRSHTASATDKEKLPTYAQHKSGVVIYRLICYPGCAVLSCKLACANLNQVYKPAYTEASACKKPDNACSDFSCHKAVNTKSAEEKRNKYCRSFVHNKILLYPISLKYNRIYSTSQRCNTVTFYHTHAFLSTVWRITVEIWRKTA